MAADLVRNVWGTPPCECLHPRIKHGNTLSVVVSARRNVARRPREQLGTQCFHRHALINHSPKFGALVAGTHLEHEHCFRGRGRGMGREEERANPKEPLHFRAKLLSDTHSAPFCRGLPVSRSCTAFGLSWLPKEGALGVKNGAGICR